MLDDEPLELAVHRLERWYNVDIEIKDETLKSYRFKATFQDEPLEEVMLLLAVSTPMEYTIKKSEITNDSIYRKKKVIIKLKE